MESIEATALTDNKRRKLESLRLYGTAYEIVATNGKSSYLVGYSRKSKRGILDMITANDYRAIYKLSVLLGIDPESWFVGSDKVVRSDKWAIVASGRTQREAIIGGELDSIYRTI